MPYLGLYKEDPTICGRKMRGKSNMLWTCEGQKIVEEAWGNLVVLAGPKWG